ncbi:hypothetical protein CFK37_01595 [Virgibacillus phasianinus]|uniref:Uncharacterized protein n=1 Tax=Virgibacillus phasianinus TaxID=2017483 RepID=A0A220TZ89_9BACI|nr:hypothetical protein [Virgibacillus phasianinus]ASK60996.1 hypothetical protein CFK37_01595 [Virgibacillus phasianinus]
MALFINNGSHGDIYKNKGAIDEPNQSYFKRDHFEELVNGQLKVNESLNHSIHGLKVLYEKQENAQTGKWKEISNRLNELKRINVQHEKDQHYVLERLRNLESQNKKLEVTLANEQLSGKELMDQLNKLGNSHQAIVEQLETYCLENEVFKSKVNDQYELQHQMADRISQHEDAHGKVLDRLENQEALMEKVTRQIEYFRTILFERTNFLAEKIENGYHHTSSYIANLITGSDQSPKKFMLNQKQDEDHKVHK